MDREPRRRRQTWFTKPRSGPNTLGQTWEQRQQASHEPDAWLTHEETPSQKTAAQQSRWQPLPPLPKWPPLPEESTYAQERPHAAAPFSSGEISSVELPQATWGMLAQDRHDHPERSPRTLWLRFRSTSRRLQIGIAVGIACVLVLGLLLGVGVLGGAFHLSAAHGGAVAGGTTVAGTGTPALAPGLATLTATSQTPSPEPATAAPVPPFTIAFTCASGAIGGKGQVCVHTRPNAIVSLWVRYCDGSTIGGRSLSGTAHADGSGDYTWQWNVTTTCAGTATATVTAKSTGQSVTQSTTFTVTR